MARNPIAKRPLTKVGQSIRNANGVVEKEFDGQLTRLRSLERVASSDVGRGDDIESSLPGEGRCIEVNTTPRAGIDFFIPANERTVLNHLREQAWLYRVVLSADGQGNVGTRVNNPMEFIGEEQLTPVVWRVPAPAVTKGD